MASQRVASPRANVARPAARQVFAELSAAREAIAHERLRVEGRASGAARASALVFVLSQNMPLMAAKTCGRH